MEWKSEYAIGITGIDEQHRTIFEHLLALENSKAKKDPRDIQRYFFKRLAEYLDHHFEIEEVMLDAVRYPDLEAHRGGHRRLAAQFRALEPKIIGASEVAELVGFFEHWFVGHVLADDRDYAGYLKELTAGR